MSQAQKVFAQRAHHAVTWTRKMKFIHFLFTTVSLVLVIGSASALTRLNQGDPLPDFSLQDAGGKTYTLKDFADHPALFAYVRPDQEDSQTLLQKCTRWQEEYPDLRIVALFGRLPEEAADYPFPLLLDPDKTVYGNWGLRVFPTVVLVNREGLVTFTHSGFGATAEEILADEIAVLMGVKTREEISREKENVGAGIQTDDTAARHFQAGKKLWDDGFPERAREEWEKSLQADSTYTPGHFYLGKYYLRAGEPEPALKHLQFALQEEATPEALILAARACLLQGDLDQAENYADRALDANRRSPEAKLTLAEIYLEENDLAESEAFVQEVMLISKRNPKAYYLLGRIAEAKGDMEQALVNYRRALELLIAE